MGRAVWRRWMRWSLLVVPVAVVVFGYGACLASKELSSRTRSVGSYEWRAVVERGVLRVVSDESSYSYWLRLQAPAQSDGATFAYASEPLSLKPSSKVAASMGMVSSRGSTVGYRMKGSRCRCGWGCRLRPGDGWCGAVGRDCRGAAGGAGMTGPGLERHGVPRMRGWRVDGKRSNDGGFSAPEVFRAGAFVFSSIPMRGLSLRTFMFGAERRGAMGRGSGGLRRLAAPCGLGLHRQASGGGLRL